MSVWKLYDMETMDGDYIVNATVQQRFSDLVAFIQVHPT